MKLLRPAMQYVREKLEYRVLPYIDDLLLASAPAGSASTEKDFMRLRRDLKKLIGALGAVWYPDTTDWDGAQRLHHLEVQIDTVAIRFFVSEKKLKRVQTIAKKLVLVAQRNRWNIQLDLLRSFWGVCISLPLALPLAHLYTRFTYFDMSMVKQVAKTIEE
eukprot:gb/GEZJ01002521.1/.p1 GENE.gb/GEZJ01002521.1/~~gb/GEZJ01002521.1/.p1  ORF type:complete len:161 (+),score=20.85 gb/GEZJ01002521.1/:1348-1830(+)